MKLNKKQIINFNILLALVLSAASSLLYEVTATKLLFIYFTENTYSISTVLSVFLLGLGIGSYLIYKFLDKIKNKRFIFMLSQFAIAVYALMIIKNLGEVLPALSTFNLFLVSFIVLLIPTIFLGTTIPLINSIFDSVNGQKNRHVGLIYALDLFGAVAGTLISGFVLLPYHGIKFSILIGVILNIFAGVFISLSRS